MILFGYLLTSLAIVYLLIFFGVPTEWLFDSMIVYGVAFIIGLLSVIIKDR